jgi:pimeloyl-ACP methyl ester carboxylesterase
MSDEESTMRESLPMVLVPGLLCSARLYSAQVEALWRFGPVTVADHTRDDTMAAIAQRILEAAPPRFALAGLSMGGYIAFAIMRQAPERVQRLALLDTSARADTAQQSERRRAQIALAEGGKLGEVADALYPLFVHANRREDAALKRVVLAMVEDTGAEAFVRQQKAIMTRPDSLPLLSSIKCPTLVLVGDGDQLLPPPISEEIAAGIAGARLAVVSDCGHLATLERPDAVNRALSDWMSG